MYACAFAGQGSQIKGMGRKLFKKYPHLIEKVNDILGYLIEEICFDNEALNTTKFVQPAIYVVNALKYMDFMEDRKENPSFLIGHSLGEYNALLASDVFTFEQGLELVCERGKLMDSVKNGEMDAIKNLSEDEVNYILNKYDINKIDIANINSSKQSIISGLEEDMKYALNCFEKEKIKYKKINVSGPFHSRYMKDANEKFKEKLKSMTFNKPKIPVVSGSGATLYSDDVYEVIKNQMCESVRWIDSINYILNNNCYTIYDIDNKFTISSLIEQIKKDRAFGEESNILMSII